MAEIGFSLAILSIGIMALFGFSVAMKAHCENVGIPLAELNLHWSVHLVFIVPIILFIIFLMGNVFLGCSEYRMFRSDLCQTLQDRLNIDLDWVLILGVMFSYFLALLIAPSALYYYSRKIWKK